MPSTNNDNDGDDDDDDFPESRLTCRTTRSAI